MKDKEVYDENKALELIKEINERQNKANEKIIKLKTELESLEKQLEDAKAKAREKIGTDDIDQCRKMYIDLRNENSVIINNALEELNTIESVINEIENSRSS